MNNNNYGWLVLGAVIVAALLLFTRKTGQAKQLAPAPIRRYINKETTDITWNEDGYPIRIVRERDATQSQEVTWYERH